MRFSHNIDFQSVAKIVNLPSSTANGEAVEHSQIQNFATQAYVDNAINGLSWKQPVLAATTANITLTNTQTIDGVVLAAGDRVLVKDQTNPAENGIYIVVDGGAWTRAEDADSADELTNASVFVVAGTVNGDVGYTQTDGITTVGSDSQTWVQFNSPGQVTAGDGLTKTGSELSVNVDDATLAILADTLQVKANGITETELNNVAGDIDAQSFVLTPGYAASAGTVANGDTIESAIQKLDGNISAIDPPSKHVESVTLVASTGYVINHDFGDQDVLVQVYDSNWDRISVDIELTSANTVTITSLVNETNARVIILG